MTHSVFGELFGESGPERLLWVDVETTGLSYMNDKILEIALMVTDGQLNSREDLVFERVIHREVNLSAMAPEAAKMHIRNDLLADVLEAEDVREVVRQARIFLDNALEPSSSNLLAGSSVHFDRRMLEEDVDLYQILGYVGHRNFDVSTLSAAASLWRGMTFTKSERHRALSDLRESLLFARRIKDEIAMNAPVYR